MRRRQQLTSRYQLLMGPWYHVTAGDGIDMERLQLQWFDQWLKGIDTGIADVRTPLHLFQLGGDKYLEASRYPFPEATPTTYYLGAGNTLSADKPKDATGADPIVFTGATSPCDRLAGSSVQAAGESSCPRSTRRPCRIVRFGACSLCARRAAARSSSACKPKATVSPSESSRATTQARSRATSPAAVRGAAAS